MAVASLIIGAIGGIIGIASGASSRAKERARIAAEQQQNEINKENAALKWEQNKQLAERNAQAIERQAAHAEEMSTETRDMGLQSVAMSYKKSFLGSLQEEQQYGNMAREMEAAQSAMKNQAGRSGLRNTGNQRRVQEYQEEMMGSQLQLARTGIDTSRQLQHQAIGMQKTQTLNAFDDAMFKVDEARTKADQIRDDFDEDSINSELYKNTQESLNVTSDFLDTQMGWAQDSFLNVMGDFFGGASSGAQVGASMGSYASNKWGWDWADKPVWDL